MRGETEAVSTAEAVAFEEYFATRGAQVIINKILVASSGITAVKAIRSLRQWVYQTFRSDSLLHLVVIVTDQDVAANSEHMRLADESVHVPGGVEWEDNVNLLVSVAHRCGVDAVWPGCGPVAVNTKLPFLLAERDISFLGPTESEMQRVRDRASNLIIAQTLGIRTLPWSGSGVERDVPAWSSPRDMAASEAALMALGSPVVVSPSLLRRACVSSVEEALSRAEKVTYPVWLHLAVPTHGVNSWSIDGPTELEEHFQEATKHHPGASVFVQKKMAACRHVVIQVVADIDGSVISLSGTDRSICIKGRRVIAEGPPAAVPAPLLARMEAHAVEFARLVGMHSAGTVEYAYLTSGEYFFLGFIPRLHEDFPITEAITGVSLVATQLHLAMGVSLSCVSDLRRLYDLKLDGTEPIDFRNTARGPLMGHCVAAKITAHDPGNLFHPSFGKIDQIQHSNHPGVFMYSAVGNAGYLYKHPQAQQIGHMFAHANKRSASIPKLAAALLDLGVLGEVACDAKHLARMLEEPAFISIAHNTALVNGEACTSKESSRLPDYVMVLCGGVVKAHMKRCEMEDILISTLQRGVPPDLTRVNFCEHVVDLIYNRIKYPMQVTLVSPSMFRICINKDFIESEVVQRSDGGLLVMLDGRTYTVYYESLKNGLKAHINGHRCVFPDDYDPSCLTTPYPGKLLRFLVEEGQRVAVGQAYAELEVMKTVLPLLSSTTGLVQNLLPKGTHLRKGDVLCRVKLDDHEEAPCVDVFIGRFPKLKPYHVDPRSAEENTYLQLKIASEAVSIIMMGYKYPGEPLEALLQAASSPSLVLHDFNEQHAAMSSRISDANSDALEHISHAFRVAVAAATNKVRTGVRGDDIVVAVREVIRFLEKHATHDEKYPELAEFVQRYKDGLYRYTAHVIANIMSDFLAVEEIFGEDVTFEEALLKLRDVYPQELQKVVAATHSHSQLHRKLDFMLELLDHVDRTHMVEIPACLEMLQRVAALNGLMYGELASKAKGLIIKKQEYARYSARKWKNMKKSISGTLTDLATMVDANGNITPRSNMSTPMSTPPLSRKASKEDLTYSPPASPDNDPGRQQHQYPSLAAEKPQSTATPVSINFPLPPLPQQAATGHTLSPNNEYGSTSKPPSGSGLQAKRSIFERMKASVSTMRTEIEKTELQCATPGKGTISMTDHFLMLNALFNRNEPAVATNAIKKMFEYQGINNVVCTVEDMGVIRAHMTNSIDSWILGTLDEAKHVLENKLGDNYYQCVGLIVQYPDLLNNPNRDDLSSMMLRMINVASKKGKIPRDLNSVFVSLLEPTSTPHGTAQFHFRRQPTLGNLLWAEDVNIREIPAAFVEFMELSRLQCFNTELIAASDSTYSSLSIPLPPITHKIEYSTLIFLATEKKPPLKGTRRDQRIFLRTMVHNKELFLGSSDERAADEGPVKDKSSTGIKKSASLMYLKTNSLGKTKKDSEEPKDSVMGDERVLGDLLAQMELAVMSKKTSFNYMFINLTNSTREDIPAVKETIQSFLEQCRKDLRRLRVAWIEVKVGPGRLVTYNPTGYQFKVEFHVDTKPPLPYPVLNRIQRKRMYAQSLGTTFVYDFVDMFHFHAEIYLKGLDALGAEKKGAGFRQPSGPCFHAAEMVLNSEGNLEEIERPIGCNDTGMVVWNCKVSTHEYPSGRNFILVANDVTHIGGSFSKDEDDIYDKGVKVAQKQGIPLVFISANSGARVGLDEAVKACFQVEWKDPADVSRGAKYIYLTEKDYKRLRRMQKLVATEISMADGTVRWRLDDLTGGLGMECLQGSAVIASTTSAAYHDIFTLTYVTGRSIGVGAYVARLSTRVIQHQDAPLLLMSATALNMILGREVYSNNSQIGGPKVMYHNGVTHMVVEDDLKGVGAILKWLSYIPCKKGAPLPYTPHTDHIERPLASFPTRQTLNHLLFPPRSANDPRIMLEAFFDKTSFCECMAEWGKTVITGRARLGGLPMGIVAVETRAVDKFVPADPAFAGAQQLVEQQPGQVFFPDSAYKTAQAISDFNFEGLPLIIFANWRGFAGGLRDMFGEVLKYGSMIVDNLRVFQHPVFVYIPHEAEIRGGAWVVIDPNINPAQMEMYAADVCRGGVLEPEACAQLKYPETDIVKTMHRLDPNIASMSPEEQERHQHELMPAYKTLAVQFAAMHDGPKVMLEKGIVKAIVPWAEARAFFAKQLRRRLAQEMIKKQARACWPGPAGDPHATQAVADLNVHVEAIVDRDGEVRMDFVDVEIYMAKLRNRYIEFTLREFSKEAGVVFKSVADEVAHEQLNADLRNGSKKGHTRRTSHASTQSIDSFPE